MLLRSFKKSDRPSLLTRLTCLGTISAFLFLSLISCSENRPNNPKPKIVATFFPVYLFTRGVTGDSIPVEILIPTNSEVHDYQATPGNIQTLAQANILIKNGLGIEEFLTKLIANADNSQLVEIDSSAGIEPIKAEHEEDGEHEKENHENHEEHEHHHEDDEHDEHDDEHEHHHEDDEDDEHDEEQDKHGRSHHHEQGDPHIWLDPVLAQQQVANIRDGLIAADPENSATYGTNANNYIAQLQELDREFKSKLAPAKGCTIISFHDAFSYLTERYGLAQIAILEIPEDNLNPQDIQKVLQAVKKFKVKALLSEPGGDKRLEQIAKDTGLPIETLDSLESGEPAPEYYFKAMRQNLASLEKACITVDS